MKKRRIASLMLCSAMAVSSVALTACGGSSSTTASNNTDSGHLVFTWWGNQVRNERTQQVLDMYSKENPSVTFDGQFSEYSDYFNKLATSAAGNTMPDILQMDYPDIQQYVDNGLLLDLTPYIENGTLDTKDCNMDAVNSGKINNGIYGMCAGINTPALFYNKTLLDKNGITVKDNMNMEDFKSLCKEVYEKTGYKTNLNYGYDQFLSYYLRADDTVLYENGKLGGSSADPYSDFFTLYEDGIKDGWHLSSSIFAERTIGSVEQDPMVYGSSADTMSWCAMSWSNQFTAFAKAATSDKELGITTWPSPDPKKSDYLNPSQFYCISSSCKNPEEAVKFLNYLTNSTECNDVLLGDRGIPVSNKVTEEITPKLDAVDQKMVSFVENVVSKNCSTINPPATAGSSEVLKLVTQLQEQVCYGQLSGKDAGKQLFEQGNGIMAAKKK